MQLRPLPLAGLLLVFAASAGAHGQSLSPTHGAGPTPSDIKGFRLTVGNPYKTRMSFSVQPMDTRLVAPVADAVVQPAELTLAPNASRQVILAFRIPSHSKERTIGLCITPKDIKGPVLPRVCGTYTGVVHAGSGG
jgi:hypothetical protein